MERGQAPCRIDVKDGALKVRAPERCRTVEIAVTALDYLMIRRTPSSARSPNRVHLGHAHSPSDLKHGAFKMRPAERRRAVEITVAALHQPRKRNGTLAEKAVE